MPNSPCRPLPGSCAPTRGDPLTAALLMTPRSTYTSSDMRQNRASSLRGVNHPAVTASRCAVELAIVVAEPLGRSRVETVASLRK